MEKIIMAVPKGRILKELNPLLKNIGIEPKKISLIKTQEN